MKRNIRIMLVILLGILLFPVDAYALDAVEDESRYANITFDESKKVSATKYFKTIYAYDENNNLIQKADYELTEFEYEKGIPNGQEYSFLKTTSANSDYWQTSYKRLTLEIIPSSGAEVKKLRITNEWKKIPQVKEYDVIGFMIADGGSNLIINSTYLVQQINDGVSYSYNSSSQNRVSKSNGEALVMNIIDSTSNSLVNKMEMTMTGDNNIVVNASYQHCVSTNVTYSQAKNLSLGSSTSNSNYMVLGNTFIYPKSVGQYYDQMQGVSVAYDPEWFLH